MNIRINPIASIIVLFFLFIFYLYYFGIPFNSSSTNEAKICSKTLLSVSIDLAERAGISIKSIRNEPQLNEIIKGKTKEGANELLTKADVNSHKILYNGLKRSFPGLNIISEEYVKEEKDDFYIPNTNHISLKGIEFNKYFNPSELTIWIDPLDATQEYSENLTNYVSVMVCVAYNGNPVIGVIHKPFTDETVWGFVDYQTSKIKRNLGNSKQLQILVSRSHAGDVEEVIKSKLPGKDVIITPAGGAGYKFLEVLQEDASLYVHTTAIKLWDVCAADAIARSVKYCSFTSLSGHQLKYSPADQRVVNNDGIIASCSPEGDKLIEFFMK